MGNGLPPKCKSFGGGQQIGCDLRGMSPGVSVAARSPKRGDGVTDLPFPTQ